MTKPKIAFFELQGWEQKLLKKDLKKCELKFFTEPLNEKNVKEIKDFNVVSVFIYSKIDAKILKFLPKLKLIATRSTGFDHIDIKEATKRKIKVANVPTYGENTVAEHTFALIMALSRNVHKSYMRVLRNDFSIEGLKGFDLEGKTIGVIGGGNIGYHVIKIAKGFGMEVLVSDINQDRFLCESMGFKYSPLDELLKKSDIVTLHVPYNKKTHHLINKDNIKLFKKGALLINTARGGLVDTEALIYGLDKKIIGGAGLDVMEGEDLIKEEKQLLYDPKKLEALGCLIKDHILLSHDNVVFTPHIAFYSQEALERIIHTTTENIKGFIDGVKFNQVV
ncbi:MAG: NAD(P)-dependent oxidoreductase [bacterium]